MDSNPTRKALYRVSQKELAKVGANFTIEGLRFHCEKMETFTNLYGGGLDKIPLNTIPKVQEYRQQYEPSAPRVANPLDEWETILPKPENRPVYLRKKAKYQVANHLLGIGKVAYWTGSTGRSTLLGLDIDDHQSESPEAIKQNATEALDLFTEMTKWHPVTCPSGRGIHGFLILDKGWLTAQATNELWNNIIRIINKEGKRRGLKATLECKGKARIINDQVEYGGVFLKDPFTGMNPTDNDLHMFWATLEEQRLSDTQLQDMLTTLANDDQEILNSSIAAIPDSMQMTESAILTPNSAIESAGSGEWIRNCRDWAIHGLREHDSMAEAVFALAKWLYFVEFWNINEDERSNKIVELLQHFCLNKHNGYITRLNDSKTDDVLSHVKRIVRSATEVTESAKTCFSRIRVKRQSGQYKDQWFFAPLIVSTVPPFPVKLTVCCTVSRKDKKEKRKPENWVPETDVSPLPNELEQSIRKALMNIGAKEKSFTKLVKLINHIRKEGGETRLGIESLKKLGFSNHASRQHIVMLREMGIVIIKEDYSPALHLRKTHVLTAATRKALGMPVFDPD